MAGIFQELKRRNVFRVAAAYAAVSWILIEAGSVLMPTFGVPNWLLRAYFLIVIGGFAVAVVLAWIFELTPGGIRLEKNVEQAGPYARSTGRKLDFFIITLLVIALGISVTLNVTGLRRGDMQPSLAVLPFDSRSTEPENAIFADGIHDDLLTRLANVEDLKVISRTSVMGYRKSGKNVRQIADELGVATVLEGAVQRSGNNVRINVQLIDAKTDEHLWAQAYNRQLTARNIFEIQSEISAAITTLLKATLTTQEEARLKKVPTQNTRAYEFYLSGREYEWRGEVQRDLRLAAQQYERAIEADPEFALAWARLSRVHIAMYWFGIDQSDVRRDKALLAAERAFALEPDLAEAHLAMAWYHYHGHRNYDEALRALTIAEKGMPGDADLIFARGAILRRLGHWEQALANLERAIDLDPRNATLIHDTGTTYLALRDYAKAEQYYDKVLEIAPDAEAYISKAWIPVYRDGDVTLLKDAVNNPTVDRERRLNIGWVAAFYDRDYAAALEYLDQWNANESTDFRTFYWPKAAHYGVTYRLAEQSELAKSQFQIARKQAEEAHRLGPSPRAPILIALAEASAGIGDTEQAIRLARQATRLMPTSRDAFDGPQVQLDAIIRALIPAGAIDSAIEELDAYLATPAFFSIEGLLADPSLDPVRDDQRFQVLVEKYSRW